MFYLFALLVVGMSSQMAGAWGFFSKKPENSVVSPRDWHNNVQKYEEMRKFLGSVVAQGHEPLIPEIKQAVKKIVGLMAKTPGIVGVPTEKEIFTQLLDDAVKQGALPLVKFITTECDVNLNSVVTLSKPNLLHSLEQKAKEQQVGPYQMAHGLFSLGLKPQHINVWDAQGQTALHYVARRMEIDGANASVTPEQFAAGMASKGFKFEKAEDVEREYKGFTELSKRRAQEWAAVGTLMLKLGGKNLKDKDGKTPEAILRDGKVEFNKKFADHLKAAA